MSTPTILITCILPTVLATEPEVLLKSQIQNAKCFAKCLKGVNSEERSLCFEICKLVQENPATDICKLDKFCTGACKTACGTQKENTSPPAFYSYFSSKCEVSWTMEHEMRQNVVFVVAGLDLGGMWHLVFDDLMVSSLALSSHMVTKYAKLEVIAVGEGNDVNKIQINLLEGYGEGCERRKTVSEESSTLLSTVSFIVLFLAASLLSISLYLCRKQNLYQSSKLVQEI